MRIWLASWIIIYLLICIFGIISPDHILLTLLKVGGIFLCLLYVIYRFPKDHLLQLAFLVTFIADIILAIKNTSEFGVLTFFAAQIVHTIRLKEPSKKSRLPILLFICCTLITTFLIIFLQPAHTIQTICFFYLIAIITNIHISWRWYRSSPQSLPAFCSLLGFCLFLCCDLCTGVSYLSLNHVFPNFLYRPANFFAWFFYYPSQILVSNSSKYATMNLKKEIVL